MNSTLCCILLFSAFLTAIHAKDSFPAYAELTTNSGVTYSNVKVLSVAPDGAVIMHSNGGCHIDVKDLPLKISQELKIQEGEAAEQYRAQRKATQQAHLTDDLKDEERAARKKQRALVAKIITDQEQQLSTPARVKILYKIKDGYLAQLSHGVLTQTTVITTNAFGTERELPGGKKWIYPELYDCCMVLVTSDATLLLGSIFKAKILLEGSKFHTLESGNHQQLHWYRIIEIAK